MIFLTVGAQMPFDRLVRTVDQWAGQRNCRDIFAQIGLTEYQPQYMKWAYSLDPPQFRQKLEAADVIVAHAGMGSILSALELGKPILVLPRRGDLRETRNDHQVATAYQFLSQGLVSAAFNESELVEKLDSLSRLRSAQRIASHASPQLIQSLRHFVAGDVSAGALQAAEAALPDFQNMPAQ